MDLHEALQETGCAIFEDIHCVTSVERLPDETYLLMTRRGVSILQHSVCELGTILERYPAQTWRAAYVYFAPIYERGRS